MAHKNLKKWDERLREHGKAGRRYGSYTLGLDSEPSQNLITNKNLNLFKANTTIDFTV